MPSTSVVPSRFAAPGSRLVWLLLSGILATVLATLLGWGALRDLEESTEETLRAGALRTALHDIRSAVQQTAIGARGFAITGDPGALREAVSEIDSLPLRLARLRDLAPGIADEDAVARLGASLDSAAALVHVVDVLGEIGAAEARAIVSSGSGTRRRAIIYAELAALEATVRAHESGLATRAERDREAIRIWLSVAALMGLVVVVLALRLLRVQVEARRKDVTRYRAIFDNTFQFIGLSDVRGTLLEVNRTATLFGGVSPDSVQGIAMWDGPWFSHDAQLRDRLRDAVAKAASGEFVRFPLQAKGADGRLLWVDFSLKPVRDADGRVEFLVPEARDITDLREAEQALAASEQRWDFALTGSDLGVWDWNTESNRVYFSERWKSMLGHAAHEVGDGLEEWSSRVHPDDEAETSAALASHLSGTTPLYESVHRVRCKDGSYRWILDRGKVVSRSATGEPLRFIGTHQDITARREAESRAATLQLQLTALLQHTPMLVALFDLEGRYLFASDSVLRLSGRPLDELIGKLVEDVRPPATAAIFRQRIRDLDAAGGPIEVEDTVGSGEQARRYRTVMFPVRDASGNLFATGSIALDVTDAHRATERLARTLQERETLLREVHHRVKNNLQVISSILSLQARAANDERVRAVLEESRQRVHSMSVIHERLYRQGDLEHIPFAEYIEELIRLQRASYGFSEARLSAQVRVSVPPLTLQSAVPIGLITNELISNCCKHAFPAGRAGSVVVSLDADGDQWRLEVIDDGVGATKDSGESPSASLGLQLVAALVGQLDGRMQTRSTPGHRVTITFPAPL